MTDTVSLAGLAVALVAPWLTGCAAVYWLLQRTGRWHITMVIGHGYLLGLFVATLLLRLSDLLSGRLYFWPVAMLLLALTVLFTTLGRRAPRVRPDPLTAVQAAPPWHKIAVATLLLLIALRYNILLQEIVLRPLYAWDAWMNWAPKAVVWFSHGTLDAFVSPQAWLQQSADAPVYTLGNRDASTYPPMVPLILLWNMLGAGTHDSSLVFLPWWLLAINVGLALYGHLRLAGISALGAVCGCYLLLNLPYLNVHTALPGYADSWLAAAFGMAVFTLHEWEQQRRWPWALLTLTLALVCTQLKVPGIVLGLIIIAALSRSRLNLRARSELILATVGVVVLIASVLVGLDVNLPGLGHIILRSGNLSIPAFGSFDISFHNVAHAVVEALAIMVNWNLLWPVLLLALLLILLSGPGLTKPSAPLFAIVLSLGFLLFVFFFTRHFFAAEKFTTINRAFLYPVPAIIFYAIVGLHNRYPALARAAA